MRTLCHAKCLERVSRHRVTGPDRLDRRIRSLRLHHAQEGGLWNDEDISLNATRALLAIRGCKCRVPPMPGRAKIGGLDRGCIGSQGHGYTSCGRAPAPVVLEQVRGHGLRVTIRQELWRASGLDDGEVMQLHRQGKPYMLSV